MATLGESVTIAVRSPVFQLHQPPAVLFSEYFVYSYTDVTVFDVILAVAVEEVTLPVRIVDV